MNVHPLSIAVTAFVISAVTTAGIPSISAAEPPKPVAEKLWPSGAPGGGNPKITTFLAPEQKANGMAVIVGPVAPCRVLDYKFRLLSHNTIRGAAGAAILNAELLYKRGLIG